jgi:hypothetical protein
MENKETLVAVDFERRFPHVFWMSSWTQDEERPAGFRYKLLSARTEPSGAMELVVALEEAGGATTELNRLEVSQSAFGRTAAIYVDGLSDEQHLTFYAVDLIKCRTWEGFDRILAEAGWFESRPGRS